MVTKRDERKQGGKERGKGERNVVFDSYGKWDTMNLKEEKRR